MALNQPSVVEELKKKISSLQDELHQKDTQIEELHKEIEEYDNNIVNV